MDSRVNPLRLLWERVNRRRMAYRRKFLNDAGTALDADSEIILKDLAHFCRAHRSLMSFSTVRGTIDPIALAQADGRREVWLRIVEHLHLDDRFLVNLRQGANDE